jgi:hypothetical protein
VRYSDAFLAMYSDVVLAHTVKIHLQTPEGALSIEAWRNRPAGDRSEVDHGGPSTHDSERERKIAQLVKELDELCLQRYSKV